MDGSSVRVEDYQRRVHGGRPGIKLTSRQPPFTSILSAREVFSLAGTTYPVSNITLSVALAIAKRLTTPSTNPLQLTPLNLSSA